MNPKVAAGGAAGAAAAVIAWTVSEFGIHMPPGIEAAVATLVGVAAGYLKRDPGTTP